VRAGRKARDLDGGKRIAATGSCGSTGSSPNCAATSCSLQARADSETSRAAPPSLNARQKATSDSLDPRGKKRRPQPQVSRGESRGWPDGRNGADGAPSKAAREGRESSRKWTSIFASERPPPAMPSSQQGDVRRANPVTPPGAPPDATRRPSSRDKRRPSTRAYRRRRSRILIVGYIFSNASTCCLASSTRPRKGRV
jgi:hypothetical protein